MQQRVIFMFAGQGSQYRQMARPLLEEEAVFRQWMFRLDRVSHEMIGESIIEQLYGPGRSKSSVFDQTLYTHPAIFMVQYALARALMAAGVQPEGVIGASLGEFVAAAIAGVLSPEQALQAVIWHAQIVDQHCPRGAMLAVMHDVTVLQEAPELFVGSALVAINHDSHFVVAGPVERLDALAVDLNARRVLCQMLPVSHGFHSPCIDAAERPYVNALSQLSFARPTIPLFSSLHAMELKRVSPEYFWQVARGPIRFSEAIRAIEGQYRCIYLDVGTSGTLANFAKRHLNPESGSSVHAVMTPFHSDRSSFDAVVMRCKTANEEAKRESLNMRAYVFPGQGSQFKGMGGDLFDRYPSLSERADRVLGYSMKRLCLEDPQNQLGQTQFTQPALFVVNALHCLQKVEETGKRPDYLAGHSLGEYNALLEAGVFDFETGLRLVVKRGELMSRASGGDMAAVLGMKAERIAAALRENGLDSVDIANYNTPSQIVICGLKADVERAIHLLQAEATMVIPLNVSGAFHSRYMRQAQEEFERFLDGFTLSEPRVPVIANVTGQPYRKENLRANLVQQITSSVRWTESICYLLSRGDITIEEVGPGKVLAGLVQKIRKEVGPLPIAAAVSSVAQETDLTERLTAPQSAVRMVTEALAEAPVSTRRGAVRVGPLGDPEFRKDYNLKYAYVTGAMVRGIASREMVVRTGKAGMMGFFGTGALTSHEVEEAILYIQRNLGPDQAYGMNLLHNPEQPESEEQFVDLYLKYGVRTVEASAYMGVNAALVRYKAVGLTRNAQGHVVVRNRIIAKVSRPEVAEAFLSPAPEQVISRLLGAGKITPEQGELLRTLPVADDITVEADSGGHTDMGVAYVLIPRMLVLRDRLVAKYQYAKRPRVGGAGGIGTPDAAAAAFILGAEYIVTGSINQCTVEAGTSDSVKDLLCKMDVQDTEYAPAGDMFEIGSRVQVLKKGLLFPGRANKLYELWRQYNSLDEIDERTRKQIQEKFFKRSFEDVWAECKAHHPSALIESAERNPKQKMAMIFKWYFAYSARWAMAGEEDQQVNYQVHCGPALGAFNQWVKGTRLEDWRNRHVDEIAELLMQETARIIEQRFSAILA